MIRVLCWNVRGIGNIASMRRLRKLCRLHNLSALFLLEPMISSDNLSRIASHFGFQHSLASYSGKIWVFWRHNLSFSFSCQSDQFLHFDCHHPLFDKKFFVTVVYAKCTVAERRLLWTSLLDLYLRVQDTPWLVCGDFNAILSLDDSSGAGTHDTRSIADFSAFVSQTDLCEMPTIGGIYTWTGVRRNGRVWRKLDRYFFNVAWLTFLPNCSVELLSRATSDHNPLLLSIAPPIQTKKVFRFQNMWLQRPSFLDVVRLSWDQPTEGYGMSLFSKKLKRLRSKLREWNRLEFGNVFENVKSAEAEVKRLEAPFDISQQDGDLVQLNQAQALLLRTLAEEELFWKQKARVK